MVQFPAEFADEVQSQRVRRRPADVDLGNAAGQLYIKVNNGAPINYPGGTAALAAPLWKPWNIDLATLGNAAELIITVFAIKEGLMALVLASITGSTATPCGPTEMTATGRLDDMPPPPPPRGCTSTLRSSRPWRRRAWASRR